MGIITRMRKQRCAYWAPLHEDDPFGRPLYDTPVELTCRWEDVIEIFMDARGNQTVSNAKVYVELDVEVDGYLRLLAEEEGSVEREEIEDMEDVPTDNEGVMLIRRFDKLPNLRLTEYLRTAYL